MRQLTAQTFVSLVFVSLAFGADSEFDSLLANFSKAQPVIQQAENAVCAAVSQSGFVIDARVAATINAETSKLFSGLATVGAKIDGGANQAKYEGVVRAELSKALKDSDDCRTRVYEDSVAVLFPNIIANAIGAGSRTGSTPSTPTASSIVAPQQLVLTFIKSQPGTDQKMRGPCTTSVTNAQFNFSVKGGTAKNLIVGLITAKAPFFDYLQTIPIVVGKPVTIKPFRIDSSGTFRAQLVAWAQDAVGNSGPMKEIFGLENDPAICGEVMIDKLYLQLKFLPTSNQ